jgi:hypothetical protein
MKDYAKLQRKREKAGELSGSAPPPIDIATLRASARTAEPVDKPASPRKPISSSQKQSGNSPSQTEHAKSLVSSQHHQGSFQLVPVSPDHSHSRPSEHPHPTPQHSNEHTTIGVPPPPWATPSSSSTSGNRGYMQDLQHQSFLRTSNGPSSR